MTNIPEKPLVNKSSLTSGSELQSLVNKKQAPNSNLDESIMQYNPVDPAIESRQLNIQTLDVGQVDTGGVPQYNSNGEQVGEVSCGGDNPNLPEGCVWVRGEDGKPIGAIAKPAPESEPETVTINGKGYV